MDSFSRILRFLICLWVSSDLQVVELDHNYRERVHKYQMHAYMYGETMPSPIGIRGGTQGGETLTDFTLAPSANVISFSDLTIYRIGAGQ